MKALSYILAVITVFSCFAVTSYAAESPSVAARGAILIECSTGDVICEHNADERLPMASTTKIMTAIIAIEERSLSDEVSVSPLAVGVEGSSVYLSANEKLTMDDLVYALMLESANDAAAAIAIEVAGSVEAFAELMNERARAIGCENTHFTNPHGLDNEEHYTTARDLARITAYALGNETFKEIVSTQRHTIPLDGGGVRLLINHNRLLRENEYVIGVKTGFTKRSGRCLVTAAERDGVTVVAVTLSDPDDWRDHTALLSFGLDAYESYRLAGDGTLTVPVPVVGGTENFVVAVNEHPVAICLPAETGELSPVISLDRFYFAPVTKGAALGQVDWYDDDGNLVATVPLIAQEGVFQIENETLWDKIRDIFVH